MVVGEMSQLLFHMDLLLPMVFQCSKGIVKEVQFVNIVSELLLSLVGRFPSNKYPSFVAQLSSLIELDEFLLTLRLDTSEHFEEQPKLVELAVT